MKVDIDFWDYAPNHSGISGQKQHFMKFNFITAVKHVDVYDIVPQFFIPRRIDFD